MGIKCNSTSTTVDIRTLKFEPWFESEYSQLYTLLLSQNDYGTNVNRHKMPNTL